MTCAHKHEDENLTRGLISHHCLLWSRLESLGAEIALKHNSDSCSPAAFSLFYHPQPTKNGFLGQQLVHLSAQPFSMQSPWLHHISKKKNHSLYSYLFLSRLTAFILSEWERDKKGQCRNLV